jgi:hypothetical protein
VTAPGLRTWLSRSIERLEALPPSEARDSSIRIFRERLEAPDQLFDPHTVDDWLDRRAGLEAAGRNAAIKAEVDDWLRKHHPRFGGRAA